MQHKTSSAFHAYRMINKRDAGTWQGMADLQQKQVPAKENGQGTGGKNGQYGKWSAPLTRPPWASPVPQMGGSSEATKGKNPLEERLAKAAEEKGGPLTDAEADNVANTFAHGQRKQ